MQLVLRILFSVYLMMKNECTEMRSDALKEEKKNDFSNLIGQERCKCRLFSGFCLIFEKKKKHHFKCFEFFDMKWWTYNFKITFWSILNLQINSLVKNKILRVKKKRLKHKIISVFLESQPWCSRCHINLNWHVMLVIN